MNFNQTIALLNELNNDCIMKNEVAGILQKWYDSAIRLRTPIRKLDYGEDIGYWNGVKDAMEQIADELGVELQ